MASTLEITFAVQALDGGQSVRGRINVVYNNGTTNTLPEILTLSTPSYTYFQEVPWVSGLETTLNAQQAQNYANAFNRDYRNVGGTNNLGAKVSGNVVTITAKTGEFENSTAYTGDILVVGFNIVNDAPPPDLTLDVTQSPTVGDCTIIQHTATASGGVPPYSLINTAGTLNGAWDGTAQNFNLNRGATQKVWVQDSEGTIVTITKNPSRNIASGEFAVSYTQFDTYSDINIESLTPVLGTTPIEYAISETDGSNKTPYQQSNVFPGVLLGTYTLYIRDVYGCEVTKTLIVTEFTGGIEDKVAEHFEISKHNSICFLDQVQERLNLKKNYYQVWKSTDAPMTRFKSSFPYHNLTLKGLDGSKISIPFTEIQTNLGAEEKTDCVRFSIDGKTGVYFDGGNEYFPNTDSIKNASPYNGFRPSWAVVGRAVAISVIGSQIIDSLGYDSDRGKYYFTVNVPYVETMTDTVSTVQVKYNIHDYNLFQADFNMSQLTKTSYFLYEYGYSESEIVGSEQSCLQEPIEDNCKMNTITWSDVKNRGSMVYQNGFEGILNLPGNFYKIPNVDAEAAAADSGAYNLRQSSRTDWKLEIDLLIPEMWEKLNAITGVDGLYINGLSMKRPKAPSVDLIGETNLRTWECEFLYGTEDLAVKGDEVVLNPSTGVEGGGGSGKAVNVVNFDGKERLKNADGSVIVVDGGSISV